MLFADIDATGWAIIIGAACVGVAGIITPIVTLVINGRREAEKAILAAKKEEREEQYRREQEIRELDRAAKIEEVRIKAIEAAKEVGVVKTTLETNTARTDTKLDEIHSYVNSALEEAQRIYAAKCRDAANERPSAVNLAEADRAEAVYEAHRAQTEKMERNRRATAMEVAQAAAVPVRHQNAGPITSAELKRDIAAVPAKVADELDERKQSPEGKEP